MLQENCEKTMKSSTCKWLTDSLHILCRAQGSSFLAIFYFTVPYKQYRKNCVKIIRNININDKAGLLLFAHFLLDQQKNQKSMNNAPKFVGRRLKFIQKHGGENSDFGLF